MRASTTDTELASRLRLAVMRLARRLRQHGHEGATASQLSALVTIEKHGPLTLGELAAHEQVQPPTMTRIVSALEEQQVVAREVDPNDRRFVRLSVTPAGRKLLDQSRGRKTAYLAARLRGFTDEEREVVERAAELLERMVTEEQP